MNAILNALARAFVSLLHPRMLWLMVWPVIVALVLWVTLAVLYWGEAAQWIAAQLHQWPAYEWAVSIWPLKLIAAWFGWILLLLLFVPAVLITAVLIISIVSMPAMAAHVGGRDYPGQKDPRSEEHTSELQSHSDLVCRLLLEKKKIK